MKRTTTEIHELKKTVTMDYNVPAHEARGPASALFHRTRLLLIERERGRCWVSGEKAPAGHPHEAHHYPVERSFAERWDWGRFARDCVAGHWGPYAQAFDWASFFVGAITITPDDTGLPYLQVLDPYRFVDDMTVNGRLLSKRFHTGHDQGVHCLPEPIYLAQKYLSEGYKFSDIEIIHHEQEAKEMTKIEQKPVPVQSVGNGEPPPPPPPQKEK